MPATDLDTGVAPYSFVCPFFLSLLRAPVRGLLYPELAGCCPGPGPVVHVVGSLPLVVA